MHRLPLALLLLLRYRLQVVYELRDVLLQHPHAEGSGVKDGLKGNLGAEKDGGGEVVGGVETSHTAEKAALLMLEVVGTGGKH